MTRQFLSKKLTHGLLFIAVPTMKQSTTERPIMTPERKNKKRSHAELVKDDDIELVMTQTNTTYEVASQALEAANGDIVDAIMAIVDTQED